MPLSADDSPGWADTQAFDTDPLEGDPRPFRETLRGLQVRELAGEALFRHFFGPLTR